MRRPGKEIQSGSVEHTARSPTLRAPKDGRRCDRRAAGVPRDTTRVMLHSTSARFPDGIANDSGALGHSLMDHHDQACATGEIPGLLDRYSAWCTTSNSWPTRATRHKPRAGRGAFTRQSHRARRIDVKNVASRPLSRIPVPNGDAETPYFTAATPQN
jgi:hypothetical protein